MADSPTIKNGQEEKEERRLINSTFSDEIVLSPGVGTYTFEEGLDAAGIGLYQWLLMLYVGFAWICDSMEMMLLSFLAPAIKCEWGISSAKKSALTSVVFLGMFFGAYTWGWIADSEGRKIGFLATAVFTAVWGFASAASPNYASLLFFRSLVGLGLGGLHVAFSLFLEFVPTNRRGVYAILVQAFWTIGALFEAGLAWAVLPPLGWRAMLAFSTVPLCILLVFYPFLSESPRYLAAKGKTLKAEKILARVAKWNKRKLPNGKLTTPFTPTSHSGPKDAKYHAKKIAHDFVGGLKELTSKSLRTTTFLLFAIWFVNALVYYGFVLLTTELQSGGRDDCDGKEVNLENKEFVRIFIDTSAELVGFLFALMLIDTIGRKMTMGIALICCGLSLLPLIVKDSDMVRTIFLFAGRASIGASFNVLFVYTPELFPTEVRAFGLGISNALSRCGGLLAPVLAVQLVDAGLEKVAEAIFSCFCIVAAVATFMIPTETMGRQLQDTVEVELTEVSRDRRQIPSDEEVTRL